MNFHDRILKYREDKGKSIGIVMDNSNSLFDSKYSRNSTINTSMKFNGTLMPGNIYTFDYLTDSKIGGRIKYINRVPVGIYCNKGDSLLDGNRIEHFIDFMAVPHQYRAEILKRIYNQYFDIIENNKNVPMEDQEPIDLRNKTLKNLLINTGYVNAYVGFKQKFIKNIKIIENTDWEMIPYLNRNTIIGKEINEIYNEYKSKLN